MLLQTADRWCVLIFFCIKKVGVRMIKDKIQELFTERTGLINQLTSPYSPIGDWKLNKQEEAKLLGNDLPYTDDQMMEYGKARANVRARINQIDEEMDGQE